MSSVGFPKWSVLISPWENERSYSSRCGKIVRRVRLPSNSSCLHYFLIVTDFLERFLCQGTLPFTRCCHYGGDEGFWSLKILSDIIKGKRKIREFSKHGKENLVYTARVNCGRGVSSVPSTFSHGVSVLTQKTFK